MSTRRQPLTASRETRCPLATESRLWSIVALCATEARRPGVASSRLIEPCLRWRSSPAGGRPGSPSSPQTSGSTNRPRFGYSRRSRNASWWSRPSDRGKYRLGFGILRLANAVSGRLAVTQQGREICEQLAAAIGETVNIAVLRSHYAVNVDQARGPSAVGTHNWVGELTPLHATSSGKILLAYMAPEARRELLETAGLPRFTEHTITSIDRLNRSAEVRGARRLRRVARGVGTRPQHGRCTHS